MNTKPLWQTIIDKYYPVGSRLRDIYMSHCSAVCNKALSLATQLNLPLFQDEITGAAMLHDIGIFLTDAPAIECHGTEPYIRHGVLGAELLNSEGAPQIWADVAERHTGAGLTAQEIQKQNLPLPHIDLLPRTQLERLICYADKFFSKSGDNTEKPFNKVRASMARFGTDSLHRFDELAREFTIHDNT